jgi:hypothetical protein
MCTLLSITVHKVLSASVDSHWSTGNGLRLNNAHIETLDDHWALSFTRATGGDLFASWWLAADCTHLKADVFADREVRQ